MTPDQIKAMVNIYHYIIGMGVLPVIRGCCIRQLDQLCCSIVPANGTIGKVECGQARSRQCIDTQRKRILGFDFFYYGQDIIILVLITQRQHKPVLE